MHIDFNENVQSSLQNYSYLTYVLSTIIYIENVKMVPSKRLFTKLKILKLYISNSFQECELSV